MALSGGRIMRGMSRTFSLGRLMVGVTVFCVLCGLVVNFPGVVILCVLVGAYSVLPAAAAWLVLARYSKQRGSLLWNVIRGSFVGFMLGLLVGSDGIWGPWWLDFARVAITSSLGAFVFGSLGLLDEVLATRKDP